MKYTFLLREVNYINKHFYNRSLCGLKQHGFSFARNQLLYDAIMKKTKAGLELTSMYKELFDDWNNMDKYILFNDWGKDEIGTFMIAWNNEKIITMEIDCCKVHIGHYIYEELGIRNYIIDLLNSNYEMKIDYQIKLFFEMNDEEFEKFESCNEDYINSLIKNSSLDHIILATYLATIESDDCKSIVAFNKTDHISYKYTIFLGTKCHYLYQEIKQNNNLKHIVSILDTKTLVKQIQNI